MNDSRKMEYEREIKRLRYIIYVYSNFLKDVTSMLEIVEDLPEEYKRKFEDVMRSPSRGICPHCCANGEHEFEEFFDPNCVGEGISCKICGFTIYRRLEQRVPC
jgi:hypothetical protein